MKKKIIGIVILMLLIATAVPAVTSLKNNQINATVSNTPLASMAGIWIEMQKLLASDGKAFDCFGFSIAIDGDTALIGAHLNDDNGADSGSAYVFTRTGTTWTQQAKLLASDGAAVDCFGNYVFLDDDTAFIAACNNVNNGIDSGSVYVFTRNGTTWSQQAKLIAADGAEKDVFGCCISVAGDTALIGAPSHDDNGVDSGSAYVFTHSGTIWTQQQKLLASDGAANDQFGYSVSISGDTAIIGAYVDDDNGVNSGSAYVFTRNGTTWTQQQKLLASDGAAQDNFGTSIALNGDTAFIGAPYNDDKGSNSGSAYVFTRTDSTWTQQAKLLASDGAAGDCFGIYVFHTGDTAIIGAYVDDDNGVNSGSAYVFTKELDQPPNKPSIQGPTTGKAGTKYNYSISTTDPDGDNVSYYILWGDNTNTGWFGPYSSGEEITVNHSWFKKGTYMIKAKAKDIYNAESDWASLKVTMPKNKAFNFNYKLLELLFERYPNLFPILQKIIQRFGLQ